MPIRNSIYRRGYLSIDVNLPLIDNLFSSVYCLIMAISGLEKVKRSKTSIKLHVIS